MPSKNYDTTLVRVAGNLLSAHPKALRKKRRKKMARKALKVALLLRNAAIRLDSDVKDTKITD